MKQLMTGNEALARGAYEFGTHFASAYPGTPSSEILKNIVQYKEIISEWAPNEKVALEAAIGASYIGGRSLAIMKHVGLNVAADPFFTFGYTGVNGGCILVSGDEPGMHSSQNEQDNRNYAKMAKIAMFEPSNASEAKEFVGDAYELSEKYDTPVMMRMTTRICHSKGIVKLCDRKDVAVKEYVKNAKTRVATPANARQMRHAVEKRLIDLLALSNNCKWNYAIYNDEKIGVITSGGVFDYAREAFGDFASYLKIGFSHPLPTTLIEEFAANVDKLYIIEENDKYIEEHVKALGIKCIGKDVFPYTGEMTPDVIIESVTGEKIDAFEAKTDQLIARPPTFCAGCPHREVFLDLGKRKDIVVAGDIGCYALGAGPPYNAIDWVLCMGASFSTAHGAQLVLNSVGNTKQKMVSVLGDSTFFHTGINSLIEAVYNKSNGVHIILDNRITGMTGGQENPGTGFNANGDVSEEISIPKLVQACGVKNIKIINPNNRADVKETIDEALASDELYVIITEWPCVLKRAYSENDDKKFDGAFSSICTVDEEKCIGCKKCLQTGCPGLGYRTEDKKAFTIKGVCVGCGVCIKECPVGAIK